MVNPALWWLLTVLLFCCALSVAAVIRAQRNLNRLLRQERLSRPQWTEDQL